MPWQINGIYALVNQPPDLRGPREMKTARSMNEDQGRAFCVICLVGKIINT
jgi:hypothetical protein